MSAFKHTVTTTAPAEMDVISSAIGDNTNQASNLDVGKAVKQGTEQNHVLCAADDEIAGFINSVTGTTVNQGFSFGGIQRKKRIIAQVGAGQTGALAVNSYVVADDQVAFGTQGLAQVKAGNPTKYLWQAIRVDGDGSTGSTVLLERQ